jgi:hypothetical protein
MRTFKVWPIATVCLAASFILLQARAQQAADNAPPRLEKLEEGEAPAITIRPPDGAQKITETRKQGAVTEVRVNSGNSTYYLKPNRPAGSALPGDAQSSSMRAAQWEVLEFGHPKKIEEVEPVPTLAPAPPRPAAAESTAPAKQ